MVQSPRYHTIFLDWDGTLSLSRFWEAWNQPDHPRHAHYRALQQQFFSDCDHVEAWMRGAHTAEDIATWLAPRLDLPADHILAELAASARTMTWADPAIPELLVQLRQRGHRLVIATDNMDTFPRWTVPGMNLLDLIDEVLDSHTLGALKRDLDPATSQSAFFAPYLRRHGLAPADCLLIDDSAGTAAAATAWGLPVVKIDRGQAVPALRELLAVAPAP